jgi:predicted phage terminase large subunit-like protein
VSDPWKVVYEKAIRDDGSLYYPQKLPKEKLDQIRRQQGSYLFANQYLNTIVPDDERRFREEWLRYDTQLPPQVTSFGFIDPAIGQKKTSDYTGIAVISTTPDKTWYLRVAARYRLTPTQIVSKAFELCEQFKLEALGVEDVAYQEALLYFISEEMIRRDKFIPIKGIKHNKVSKETRILGLVPRFEYSRIFCVPGLYDFEEEYLAFPRGSHDDILDALASLEELVYYPVIEEKKLEQPHSPHDPDYERWVRQQLVERANADADRAGPEREFGL